MSHRQDGYFFGRLQYFHNNQYVYGLPCFLADASYWFRRYFSIPSNFQAWGWTWKAVFSVFDHLVVPITKLIDFIYFTPLNTSNKVIYTSCILYPLLYYIEATLYGIFSSSHWYPYWFLNPSKISYILIVLLFFVLLFIFVVIIHYFTRFISDIKKNRESQYTLPLSA